MNKPFNAALTINISNTFEEYLEGFQTDDPESLEYQLIKLSKNAMFIAMLGERNDGYFDSTMSQTINTLVKMPPNWKVEISSPNSLESFRVHFSYKRRTCCTWAFSFRGSYDNGSRASFLPPELWTWYSIFHLFHWAVVKPYVGNGGGFRSYEVDYKYLSTWSCDFNEAVEINYRNIKKTFKEAETANGGENLEVVIDRSITDMLTNKVQKYSPSYLKVNHDMGRIDFQLNKGGNLYTLFQYPVDSQTTSVGFIKGSRTYHGNPTNKSDVDYLAGCFKSEVEIRKLLTDIFCEDPTLAEFKKLLAPMQSKNEELLARIRAFVA